ncbi:MAG: molybdopterin-dependent oxidoreductase [Anaerolineae bacterium]|nr:molybdopterin-dependent oxidoreductase [Anaerolineae bacterium]
MKEKLTRFLNAVANLTQTQQPAWATPTGQIKEDAPPVEPIDLATTNSSNPPTFQPPTFQPSNLQPSTGLTNYPPPEKWDNWVEYDPKAWPRKKTRNYMLIPTICFNCESACGLLGYVDKDTLEIQKFEGNPLHPGSRGRNCAKGPATHNQIYDPERILFPLKRVGQRGEGKWQRVTWDEVMDDLAARIRKAFLEERHNEIMYHVGRPGHDGLMEWVLFAWGVDSHNSHTNVCSASARAGYAFWMGLDRPSPDHANARVILLLSSHLETGHYFNPHAQRIMEGKQAGAKLIVIDTRLSNTASHADYWLSPWPGSEAVIFLAIANRLIQTGQYNHDFVRTWVNWAEYLRHEWPDEPCTFETFEAKLKEIYAGYTFDYAAAESGVEASLIRQVAEEVARCEGKLASHTWRSATAGHLGGWQIARTMWFLNVLTGSVGVAGGVSASAWDKWTPRPVKLAPHPKRWNELTWPQEYPLSFFELSHLLPHFLKEGRGKLDTYFTRVYNPVWTNPDGMSWLEVLTDEAKVGLHVCLTPTWSETAWFADYVLPMGHAAERYDTMSQETHAGAWLAFRQPVRRTALERLGQPVEHSHQANPGEVWEETEFWIELSWRIDCDGSLGIRQYFESPYRPGQKITAQEYYRWMFENSVPGLPEAAAKEGLTPYEYMSKYGAFEIRRGAEKPYAQPVAAELLENIVVDSASSLVYTQIPAKPAANITPLPAFPGDERGRPIGLQVNGQIVRGFDTPSRRLEFYSTTLRDWGWPEHAVPGYIKSHVHPDTLNREANEFVLLPTFRLPTMIHTRSGNSKWLNEISHKNPLWLHPSDAGRLGVNTGDLVRVTTDIGYFVIKCWLTEGIRPGVAACSHHMGRWRLQEMGMERWSSALVDLQSDGEGRWRMRQLSGVQPFESSDPDSQRVWWKDVGVHQNLTFPVHPDPISGMHCWHQKVKLEKAAAGDSYGDIFVDTQKSYAIYREWLAMTRPAGQVSPDGTRRPYWLLRPFRPQREAYRLPQNLPQAGEVTAPGSSKMNGSTLSDVPEVGIPASDPALKPES